MHKTLNDSIKSQTQYSTRLKAALTFEVSMQTSVRERLVDYFISHLSLILSSNACNVKVIYFMNNINS